jgi:hypothetical protein
MNDKALRPLLWPAAIAFLSAAMAMGCGPSEEGYQTTKNAPTPAVSALPKISVAVVHRAKHWYHMLQAGDLDRSQMTSRLNATLTKDKLEELSSQLRVLGNPRTFVLTDAGRYNGSEFYRFRVGLARSVLLFTFAVDPRNKISGLLIGPFNT